LKINFLTFDCYGTLIDWKKGIEENFERNFLDPIKATTPENIFEKYVRMEAARESQQYESYRTILKETSFSLAKDLGLEPSQDSAEKFSESIESWRAFPDTAKTLHEFGRMGMRRYILSNIDSDILEKTIENNKLEIDGFVTAEQVRSYKPAKQHWLEFMNRTGSDKEEVIHIAGSVFHDIVPAKELGITTIWVNRYQEKKDSGADYTVESLSEIPPILNSMLS
jgi:2-haloacid dehalogenase